MLDYNFTVTLMTVQKKPIIRIVTVRCKNLKTAWRKVIEKTINQYTEFTIRSIEFKDAEETPSVLNYSTEIKKIGITFEEFKKTNQKVCNNAQTNGAYEVEIDQIVEDDQERVFLINENQPYSIRTLIKSVLVGECYIKNPEKIKNLPIFK